MNLKTWLVIGMTALMGCYLPPETEPHQRVRVIYVYSSFYDYRYDDFRYQNCWSMDCLNYPTFTNRPRTGIMTPFGVVPYNGIPNNKPKYPDPQRNAPRIAHPRPQELPHRMVPRPPEQTPRSEPLRPEPRIAKPRPQESPRNNPL